MAAPIALKFRRVSANGWKIFWFPQISLFKDGWTVEVNRDFQRDQDLCYLNKSVRVIPAVT